MAVVCPKCNSGDTQAELNTFFCFNCGARTHMSKIPYSAPSEPVEE